MSSTPSRVMMQLAKKDSHCERCHGQPEERKESNDGLVTPRKEKRSGDTDRSHKSEAAFSQCKNRALHTVLHRHDLSRGWNRSSPIAGTVRARCWLSPKPNVLWPANVQQR